MVAILFPGGQKISISCMQQGQQHPWHLSSLCSCITVWPGREITCRCCKLISIPVWQTDSIRGEVIHSMKRKGRKPRLTKPLSTGESPNTLHVLVEAIWPLKSQEFCFLGWEWQVFSTRGGVFKRWHRNRKMLYGMVTCPSRDHLSMQWRREGWQGIDDSNVKCGGKSVSADPNQSRLSICLAHKETASLQNAGNDGAGSYPSLCWCRCEKAGCDPGTVGLSNRYLKAVQLYWFHLSPNCFDQ